MPMPQSQIVGILERDAEARNCLGGAYVVLFELRGTSTQAPVFGTRQCGHGEAAALAAHAQAWNLKRGTPVRIWCSGWTINHTAGQRMGLELIGVDLITPLSAAPDHSEQQSACPTTARGHRHAT